MKKITNEFRKWLVITSVASWGGLILNYLFGELSIGNILGTITFFLVANIGFVLLSKMNLIKSKVWKSEGV